MILYDYRGGRYEADVDLDNPSIELAILNVISGDEVLTVFYEDGTIASFDADTNYRIHDYHDASYVLVSNGRWQVDRDGFYARRHSYDNGWAKGK